MNDSLIEAKERDKAWEEGFSCGQHYKKGNTMTNLDIAAQILDMAADLQQKSHEYLNAPDEESTVKFMRLVGEVDGLIRASTFIRNLGFFDCKFEVQDDHR